MNKNTPSVRVAERIENRDVGKTSRYDLTDVRSLEVTMVDVLGYY